MKDYTTQSMVHNDETACDLTFLNGEKWLTMINRGKKSHWSARPSYFTGYGHFTKVWQAL